MWTESDYEAYRQRRTMKPEKPARGEEREDPLQRSCEEYLQRIGAWYLHLNEPKGNRPGIPDLIVIYRARSFGIELKSRTGKATKEQMNEMGLMQFHGATVAVVRTLEEFIQTINGKQNRGEIETSPHG